MGRLPFGHGFVPRIGWANHRAIDRAVSPPGLFGDEPSEIPWVLVDGAWATPDTPLLTQLRNLGVDVLQAARASMVTVNSSLQGNGFESLPVEHVENQLAALQRIMARHTAA